MSEMVTFPVPVMPRLNARLELLPLTVTPPVGPVMAALSVAAVGVVATYFVAQFADAADETSALGRLLGGGQRPMVEKPHDHAREALARVAGGDGGGAWMRGDGGHEEFL